MKNTNITLQEYATFKESRLEEVVDYALAFKGLTLPPDPDYIFDEQTFYRLDPVLCRALHYSSDVVRPEPGEVAAEPENAAMEAAAEPGDTAGENAAEPEAAAPRRCVGKVDSFGGDGRGMARTYSQQLQVSRRRAARGTDVYLSSEACADGFRPNKEQWITFVPRLSARRWEATDIRPIRTDREGAMAAIVYFCEDGIIPEAGQQRDSQTILALLYMVDRLNHRGELSLFLDCFAAYLTAHSERSAEQLIEHVAQTYLVCSMFIELLPQLQAYEHANRTYMVAIQRLIAALLRHSALYVDHLAHRLLRGHYEVSDHRTLALCLCHLIRKQEPVVRAFLEVYIDTQQSLFLLMDEVPALTAEHPEVRDLFGVELFALTGDKSYLASWYDKRGMRQWLGRQDVWLLVLFMRRGLSCFDVSDWQSWGSLIVPLLPPEETADLLQQLPQTTQKGLIIFYPKADLPWFTSTYLVGAELVAAQWEHYWERCAMNVRWMSVVVDTSDGRVGEWVFRFGRKVILRQGTEGIEPLLDALRKTAVVVGYETKAWREVEIDGVRFHTDGYVWDVAAMERLLHPKRGSFVLRAVADRVSQSEQIAGLFQSQLCRIASDGMLYKRMLGLLPEVLQKVIGTLRQPVYQPYVRQEAALADTFFAPVAR